MQRYETRNYIRSILEGKKKKKKRKKTFDKSDNKTKSLIMR